MVGLVSVGVAIRVSFLAGLVMLFLARVRIGWLFVTGGGDGGGCDEVDDELDGCVGCVWIGDGGAGFGERFVFGVSVCTCAELDNDSFELISNPLTLTCS